MLIIKMRMMLLVVDEYDDDYVDDVDVC